MSCPFSSAWAGSQAAILLISRRVCVFVWGLVESQSSQPHSVYSLNESNQRAREFEYSHHRLPFDDDVGLFLPSFLRHW